MTMTVNDYANKVTEIMVSPQLRMDPYLEDHEVEWVVGCFNAGTKPSGCVYGIDDIRIAYINEQRRLQREERIDQMLQRVAA